MAPADGSNVFGRNKRVAALGIALAVLLVLATVVSVAFAAMDSGKYGEITKANAELTKAYDQAEDQRLKAEYERGVAFAAGQAAIEQNRNLVDAQLGLLNALEDRLKFVPKLQDVRAQALDKSKPRSQGQALEAARGSLRSAIVAGLDAGLAGLYTGRALDCLRQRKARGWADVVSLETDPDLEPIRDAPAFRALLAGFWRPGGEHR